MRGLAWLLLTAVGGGAGYTPTEGRELLGKPAPELVGIQWIQGGPLDLAALRGKVVLVRFWLTGCPLCAATAPALRELDEHYRAQGLVVVGIHHPKSADVRDSAVVRRAVRGFGWAFPVGIDNDWKTVRAYGVGTHFRRFTSISVLFDRRGIIRFVHDGGEFHAGGGPDHRACNRAYEAVTQAVEQALGEGRPSAGD